MLEGERKQVDEKVNEVATKTGLSTTVIYIVGAVVVLAILYKLFG